MGQNLNFIPIFFLKKNHLKNLYRSTKIFLVIERFFSSSCAIPAFLLSQLSWINKYTQIEDNHVYLRKITAKNISILSQLFEEGNLKPWDNLKLEHNLTNNTYSQWLQLNMLLNTSGR